MTRSDGVALGSALALGLLLAWWAPTTQAQSTIYTYDGAGNMTGATNTANDPLNCGAVGRVCPTLPNTVPSCAAGACGALCKASWGDCNGTLSDGCERALTTTMDCGACGRACSSSLKCSSGACVPLCTGVNCGAFKNCNPDTGSCVAFIP